MRYCACPIFHENEANVSLMRIRKTRCDGDEDDYSKFWTPRGHRGHPMLQHPGETEAAGSETQDAGGRTHVGESGREAVGTGRSAVGIGNSVGFGQTFDGGTGT